MQLAHPKVAQPKLGAYSAPSLLLVSSTHPARMPDGPAKKPGVCPIFVAASHQTRLDTRSKARRPINVGIKGRGRSGTSRDSNPIFVAVSHQTRLDTRSKARRPIKVGIKGRGRSGTSRDSNPACLCCSSAHLVQCEPDEASSFTNPNVGPGTYSSLRLKLDAWSSAVQRGQKCSSPTRRLPSRSWGPIRPRVCSWFRAPIRHECQTAQLKSRGFAQYLSLPPTRHDLTQGQKPEGQLKWG